MDTLSFNTPIERFGRAGEMVLAIAILLALVLSQFAFHSPMYANDLIANTVISNPSIYKTGDKLRADFDPEYQQRRFDYRMSVKYSGLKVNNVTDGIKHIQMVRYYGGRPVRINVVEMNRELAKNYEVMPARASNYSLHSKSTLRTIAGRTNSIVAINGGFFKPQSGLPLGTLMIDGKIYTGPVYNRVALGIFDDGYDVSRVEFDGVIRGNGKEIKIDNINQPRMLSSYVLAYTRDWGTYAPVSPKNGVQLQISGNKIISASANPLSIPHDGYVLVGPKDKLSALFGASYVEMELGISPKWENVKHIISGGPYLVKNGDVYVDVSEEKLLAIGGRNPRSAIGYTADNDLIIVAVDGREGSSVGLTLNELASFMKSLGCINAINLDGGGSTVMYVNGSIVNKPPQPGGIALSNAVVISPKIMD